MTTGEPTRVMGGAVLGRYRLGSILGRGGAATVYRGRDETTGDDVAVKEIPIGMEMARRAGAEVRAACRLEHPAVVRLLDFGEDDHACYLVSELVEGDALSTHITAGTLSARQTISAVADVLDGLAHAHERGVTHRDVKPANILIERDGRGRLTDFGIARIQGEAGLTMTGGLIGTVSYMAPEQARGAEAGPASDVYSACIVLYEGLTGVNPQAGANTADTLRRVADGRVPPIAGRRGDLPRDVCRAIDAGLHPDPRRRPDPAALAAVLRQEGRNAPRTATATAGSRHGEWVRSGEGGRSMPSALVRLAPAAVAGGVAAVVAERWWGAELGAGLVAAIGLGVAGLFAMLPWLTTVAALMAGGVLVAREAPATALLLGAVALVMVAPIRSHGRLAVIPAAAPILAGLGVAPVVALAAGLVRGWFWRIWAAVSSLVAVLLWQVIVGADPAVDGGRLTGVWADLKGERSPLAVVEHVGAPLAERPAVAVTAGLLAAGALLIPVVLRLRRGIPRVLGVFVWLVALVVAVGVAGGSVENAIGAFLPGGILVAVAAAAPLQRFRRGADRRATVTLRSNAVERLPAS